MSSLDAFALEAWSIARRGAVLGALYCVALWTSGRRLAGRPRQDTWMALDLVARLALVVTVFLLVVRAGGGPALGNLRIA